MGKKLDLTEPIIAWLLEPDSSRAEVAAMLRDTGKRFELAVPFRGNFDKYQQWFLSSGTVVLNDKPLEPVELPSIIRTVSNGRFYTLVGCQVSGSVSAGTGTGIVVPTYVVFGTSETNFEKYMRCVLTFQVCHRGREFPRSRFLLVMALQRKLK